MARLPHPGGDLGNWGTILNEYLSQAHQADGTLKDDSITARKIEDGTITEVLLDNSLQVKINAGAPNATAAAAGTLRLAGDLAGTATSPTVPGLADKVNKGDLALNVKDFGAVGDGITDDTAAIQAAIESLPVGTTASVYNTKMVGGGGVVLFPRGIYRVSGANGIQLKNNVRLVGHGATIDYIGSGSAITRKAGVSPYDMTGVGISGFVFKTSTGTGVHAIRALRFIEGAIRDILVFGFTGDGILLEQCQWLDFSNVTCNINGGYGVNMGHSSDGYRSNNNTFTRCKFEGNTLGGARVAEAHQDTFLGCTFQFSGSGYGLHIASGEANAITAIGCHFEGNRVHVYVQADSPTTPSGMPRGIGIISPFFMISAATQRFIINEGQWTRLLGGSCPNDGTNMPVTSGTAAPFQQHSVAGTMQLDGFGSISGLTNLLCNESGVEFAFTANGSTHPGDVYYPNGKRLFWQNSVGTYRAVAYFNSNNNAVFGNPSHITRLDGTNLGLLGNTGFGSGAGVVSIPNATTVPTGNNANGGILFVEGGALKYRGSSGTVTTLGPA